MRIYRNGEYFSEGLDLHYLAAIADEPVSLYSFHPNDYRAYKMAEINAACEAELAALKATYPESEVLSWDKQEAEARAFTANPLSPTPLLDALSTARSLSKTELVSRVLAKADTFAVAAGTLLGKRQKLEDQLNTMTDWEEMASVCW